MTTASQIEGDQIPDTDQPRIPRSIRRRSRSTWGVLAAAAVPTLVYFLVVLRNMTYAWDDFIQFGVTTRFGVGRELLTYNLFEHFGPVNRLVHGLLVTWGGLDVRWGIAFAVCVFYVYCVAMVHLAKVLGASWGRTWLALAICTVTPSTVLVGAFLDPFTHVLIPVAASAVAMAACIRWAQDRGRRHAVVATLAVSIACLTQERGIFIIVLLVGTRLLVAERDLPVQSWFRTLVQDGAFFIGPILAGATTAWIVATYYATDAPRGGVLETAEFVARAWTTQFVPMLTGTYALRDGVFRTLIVVVVNLAVVALLAWSIRRDVRNVRPWLLLLGWFGLHMAFVGFGRLGLGTMETFLADPNFYSYQLPAVLTLVACLRGGHRDRSAASDASPRSSTLVLAAAAVVAAILVVGSSLPVSERPSQLDPEYLATSVDDVRAANASGPATIAPTRLPADLVPPGYAPYNSGGFYLRQADENTVVDLDPAGPRFLDSSGHLTDGTAMLLAAVPARSLGQGLQMADGEGALEGTGYCVSSSDGGHASLPLPETVESPGGALWLRIIVQGSATSLRPASWSGSAWTDGPPDSLEPGTSARSYVLDAAQVAQIDLLDLVTDDLCVQEVQIYAMSAEGQSGCGWVDADGAVHARENTTIRPRCRS